MRGPSAIIATATMVAICVRNEACSPAAKQEEPTASCLNGKRILVFPNDATTRAPTIITGVTFAAPQTTTEAPRDCTAAPCDRGRFCNKYNRCHYLEDACCIGELPPYRLCHDWQNPWCRFQLEPVDKTACGRLRPESLKRRGWSITEGNSKYQERIKKLRQRQEFQMKQLCRTSPPEPEGWQEWCGN